MAEPGQIETRSVLFTNVVNGADLHARLGEEGAEALQRRHDVLLTEAVSSTGGTVIKNLGDGLLATFESAADAVAAAVAVQQAAHPEPFEVRVGLSAGDVSAEEGDVFGVPVIEAARLCGVATSGEILVAELVRVLARGRGVAVFEPMGDLELKGLPEPVPACRLVWTPPAPVARATRAPEDGSGRVPVAASLAGAAVATGYVGREALRDQLMAAWRAATAAPGCRTVLLTGEPGVGKTRTAAEMALLAHAEGALVLAGHCDEGLGVPYQPFAEALNHYVTYAGEDAVLGRFGGELVRLMPDLGDHVPGLPPPVASDPASQEHRLFEAAAAWIIDAARANPPGVLLVLDDIHWATKPTLLLLHHVVRTASLADAPVFLLATYRDTDVDRAHPLAAAIGNLRRLQGVERLAVDNLSFDEVTALMAAAAGHDLDEPVLRLAHVVHAETEGNPFFVGEVLRHLIETGSVRRVGDRWVVADPDHVAVPEGVRDVVGRRLNRLSPTANAVLPVAAVAGREFDVGVLVAVADATEDDVLDALDEAVRARLVEETGADRYRFSHALVRTTLFDELTATRRRRLHRRVADAIEKVRPHDVVALSHHLVQGGPEGDMSRAVHYTVAAGEQALASRAFGEAEVRFRQALELLEDGDLLTEEAAALCGLGEAQRDQGDGGYRDTLLTAARRAQSLGDIPLLCRAVLSNSRGTASIIGNIDPERLELSEAALQAVGPDPTPTRARLLAHLAAEATFAGDFVRPLALADEAEALARALGDADLLAWVLVRTAYVSVNAERTHRAVERSKEMLALADATGDPTLRCMARLFAANAFLAAGHYALADTTLDALERIAEAEGSPMVRWIAGTNAVRPLGARARFAEAAARNEEAANLGYETGQQDVATFYSSAYVSLCIVQGSGSEMVDAGPSLVAEYPNLYAWRTTHAWMAAKAGRLDEARRLVVDYGLDPEVAALDPIPFTAAVTLGQIADMLGDTDLATRTRTVFAPYRACVGAHYTGMNGTVGWALALCAMTLGDWDDAVALLEETIDALAEAEYVAWVTLISLDLARALAGRGDASRARVVGEQVVAEATASGAEPLAQSARGFLAGLKPAP